MSERRAKVARCQHGVIHAAHSYAVGNEESEQNALQYVRDSVIVGDTIEDIPSEDVVFGGCRGH